MAKFKYFETTVTKQHDIHEKIRHVKFGELFRLSHGLINDNNTCEIEGHAFRKHERFDSSHNYCRFRKRYPRRRIGFLATYVSFSLLNYRRGQVTKFNKNLFI